MEELRRFPRLDISVHTEWEKVILPQTDKGLENLRGIGNSKNIGAGGICLNIDEVKVKKLKVGDILDIKFDLPTNETIKVLGKIKWISKSDVMKEHSDHDAGIEFLDITSKDRALITNFVRDRFIFKGK